MKNSETSELLKKAESAVRTLHGEAEALRSKTAEDAIKIARLEELEAREEKRERATKIAERMIEDGHIVPEDKFDKVGELLDADLDRVEGCLDLMNDNPSLSLGEIGKHASDQYGQDDATSTFYKNLTK